MSLVLGLQTDGMYRVNGNFDDVRSYKEQIDGNADPNILVNADTYVLCSLLKQFLRELPMPLVTYDTYQDFLDAKGTYFFIPSPHHVECCVVPF